jgi:uncharacterized protein
MWYAIYSSDSRNSLEQRLARRPEHRARLESLLQEGRLLLAGPRPAIDAADPGPAGYAGSLVVACFESLEEAREWAEADPYVAAGVYEKVDVSPFVRVMPP